jgi:hypothetical protein
VRATAEASRRIAPSLAMVEARSCITVGNSTTPFHLSAVNIRLIIVIYIYTLVWVYCTMQVVVVANDKDGVGKSTLACHLAWDFAERAPGRVAFLDLDPQANSSATLKASDCQVAAARLFDGAEVEVLPAPTLSLFPASRALGDIDRLGDAERVRSFLARLAGLAPQFDYCVVDTRPADGLLVRAALIAADHVLCPIELERARSRASGRCCRRWAGSRRSSA